MISGSRAVRQIRVGPSGLLALQLLGRCPRMPTDAMQVVLGHRQAVTTAQLLGRLRKAGLVKYHVYRSGLRPARLWTLSNAGRDCLLRRRLSATDENLSGLGCSARGAQRDPIRQRDIPLLIACYRLLARVAVDFDGGVEVCRWEHPWIRTLPSVGPTRRVRLPAGTVLARRLNRSRKIHLLLIPDLGTAHLRSYRPALQALIQLRCITLPRADDWVLVVGVAISARNANARVEAWHSLLRDVEGRTGEQLTARVVGLSSTDPARDHARATSQADEIFAMIARHPLMTIHQLARVLRTTNERIERVEAELVERGWVRRLPDHNLPPEVGNHARRWGVVELTSAGRREAARRLYLPPAAASRSHGLLGGRASTRPFLRHRAHTEGANGVFVSFITAARQEAERGVDTALEEWRSGAACARGRFRPDGYGAIRRGGSRFGFFLEFDRATESPRQYAAKLAAYYRYRDSGRAARDYVDFPVVLVVTTSDRGEERFAHSAYLAQQRHPTNPLQIFLTTSHRIEDHTSGVLGPVWREPGVVWSPNSVVRGCWLPMLAARSSDREA
jgi:Replication-relaxation